MFINTYTHICTEEGKQHRHSTHSTAQFHTPPMCKINTAIGLVAILQNATNNGLRKIFVINHTVYKLSNLGKPDTSPPDVFYTKFMSIFARIRLNQEKRTIQRLIKTWYYILMECNKQKRRKRLLVVHQKYNCFAFNMATVIEYIFLELEKQIFLTEMFDHL